MFPKQTYPPWQYVTHSGSISPNQADIKPVYRFKVEKPLNNEQLEHCSPNPFLFCTLSVIPVQPHREDDENLEQWSCSLQMLKARSEIIHYSIQHLAPST
jgi:hypothetical protein